ncbi:MAG: signal peptide peptidase SppA [Spirochaetaceae bacterium]
MIRSRAWAGLLISALYSVVSVYGQFGSVAVNDGYDAGVVNPAALAVGNAAGIAGELGYTDSTFGDESDFGDAFALFLSGRRLGYAYQQTSLTELHTLVGAVNPVRNFYTGISYGWAPGDLDEGDLRLGALLRPANALSGGATVTFLDSDTTAATLGVGVRPLFAVPAESHRLTLFGDLPYDGESWLDPRIGVSVTPVDGFDFAIGYDIETERFRGSLAFSFPTARVGNRTRFDPNNELESGAGFLHITPKRFRSLSVPLEDTFIDYAPGPMVVERRSLPTGWPFTEIDQSVSALELVTEIRNLASDESVEGILFKNHSFVASAANIMEIREALNEFRAAGKRVVYYYEGVDNMNYALAAATADRIYLHPAGFVYLTGDSITRPYLRELLEKVGIEVRNIRSSRYKNFGNIFSEYEMQPAEEEALSYLLDGLHAETVAMIDSGRGEKLARSPEETINGGPYLIAERALEAGLVDGLLYEDELPEALEELARRPRIRDRSAREEIRYAWTESGGAKVGLVYVTGPITTGSGSVGQVAGSDRIARALRAAREDPTVEAILLRVASNGGSALASETIAREVELATTGDDPKPVVVSMGGTAASGGYYVATYADEIIAQPNTVTGSIGVVALMPNIAGLSEKLGINWETLRRGENADLGAPYRRLDPEQLELFQESVDATYQRFVEAVSEGREMSPEAVEEAAQGRVWTGRQAEERGLVDGLGGLYTAIAALEERLDRRVRLQEFTGERGMFGSPLPELAREAVRPDPTDELPPEVTALLDSASVLDAFGKEAILFLAPYPVGPEPRP